MPRTHHSEAQCHKKFFRSAKIQETCKTILGRDFKITVPSSSPLLVDVYTQKQPHKRFLPWLLSLLSLTFVHSQRSHSVSLYIVHSLSPFFHCSRLCTTSPQPWRTKRNILLPGSRLSWVPWGRAILYTRWQRSFCDLDILGRVAREAERCWQGVYQNLGQRKGHTLLRWGRWYSSGVGPLCLPGIACILVYTRTNVR